MASKIAFAVFSLMLSGLRFLGFSLSVLSGFQLHTLSTHLLYPIAKNFWIAILRLKLHGQRRNARKSTLANAETYSNSSIQSRHFSLFLSSFQPLSGFRAQQHLAFTIRTQ